MATQTGYEEQELPDRGLLYVSTPFSHAQAVLRNLLHKAILSYEEPHENVFAVALRAAQLWQLAVDLIEQLGPQERRETRCCLFEEHRAPALADLMRSKPLESMFDAIQGQWLIDVLRARRLETFFQPIVCTGNPENVFAYECLLRARHEDGQLIYPNRLFSAARATGLLCKLDRMARLTAIETAARRRLSTRIFINFNPAAIDDPIDCLRSTVEAAERSGIPPEQFVFEVVESEEIHELDGLLEILKYYRQSGFGVALDDLGAGYSSLNLLTRLKPDYIKLDIGLVHNVDRDPYKSKVAAKLLELARNLGVRTVVEGVETRGEWKWARTHGADYVQGFLFARPDAIPPLVQVPQDVDLPLVNA